MKRVSLFMPCTVDLFLPEIGEAVYHPLKRLGIHPIYHPELLCDETDRCARRGTGCPHL
jgi:Fe-S oxidoreductase